MPNELLRGVGIQLTDLVFEDLRLQSEIAIDKRERSASGKMDGFLKRKQGSSLFEQAPLVEIYVPQQPKRSRTKFFTPVKKKQMPTGETSSKP